jgi:hypothetical protein
MKKDVVFIIILSIFFVIIVLLPLFLYCNGSFYKKYKTLHGPGYSKNRRQLQYQFSEKKRKERKERRIKPKIKVNGRNVFMFWIGKDYKLIKLLRDIIYHHGNNEQAYTVHLINHDNIFDYIDNEKDFIPDTFFTNLIPAHQADFLRVYLLNKYGGIWLDSDTLVLNDLSSLFELMEKSKGFFIKEDNKYIWNGVFGSRANTPLMNAWMKDVYDTLFKKKTMRWSEIGSESLDSFYSQNGHEYFDNQYVLINGLDTVYPITPKKCVEELLHSPKETYKKHERDFQPFLVLVNSVYKELEKGDSFERLNETPLGQFIQKSLLKNY